MAIHFKCACGADGSADESRAGQTIRCAACGQDVPVPAPADAPVAGVVSEGPSAMDDLRATVGKGDVNEMIAQITGVRPAGDGGATPSAGGTGSAAPGVAAGGPTSRPGPATGGLASASGARAKSAPPPPLTPKDRAAHHFGFKRVMWIPSLLIGLVCAGFGVWCFIPHEIVKGPGVVIEEPEIVADAQGKLFAIPRGTERVDHPDGTVWSKNAAGQELPADQVIVTDRGGAWLIPPGQKYEVTNRGNVYLLKPADENDPESPLISGEAAKPADEAMRIFKHEKDVTEFKSGREEGYFWFGIALFAVAAVLIALSLWMVRDVRLVRREMAAREAAEAPASDEPAGP